MLHNILGGVVKVLWEQKSWLCKGREFMTNISSSYTGNDEVCCSKFVGVGGIWQLSGLNDKDGVRISNILYCRIGVVRDMGHHARAVARC